ncbi:hypothetical protein D6C84_02968 [Aureobasidium pullulans]|uniref:Uncharacterized protein n=1 Tax=Aureobasidium pullulans TaxID=5580 RepID=A0A4S9XZJ6_AURPU|nr:hypothetical protein D6C84_02968 [Aureobasidium pullulans]
MASSHTTDRLSHNMEKMSLNSKRHADAPRYTPPHRKSSQAPKTSDTRTPPTSTMSVPNDNTPTAAPEQAAESVAEPKTTTKSMPPHKKYPGTSTASTKAPVKEPEVAESWEEEAGSDKDITTTPQLSAKPESVSASTTDRASSPAAAAPKSSYISPHLKNRSAAPSPPSRSLTPPTTTTTTLPSRPISRPSSSSASGSATSTSTLERRPEKTNAVAHRLIAGALGVKMPRRTEEQRAYDKAIREQEKRKRDVEREARKKAEEDAAKAKAAIWDD